MNIGPLRRDDVSEFLPAEHAEEKKLEKPLRKWAEAHGYAPRDGGRNLELWLRP